jgi:hypothetical protein
VFCRKEEALGEVPALSGSYPVSTPTSTFGLCDGFFHSSDLATGSDELWDWAEARLGDAARQCGAAYSAQPSEGTLYRPKLEFALRDRYGRSWYCATVQMDCVLPERLGASYVPSWRLPILYVPTGKLRGESPLESQNAANGQGRSGQRDGRGRFSWPGKVAAMDPQLAQALQKLAKKLPAGFSVDEATLTHRAEDYQNAQGTSRAKKRRPLVSDLYDKLSELSAHPEKQAEFIHKLQKRQTIEWGFDFSSLIAQYYMKRSGERARRYAYAVCGAALKGIPAGGLASALGKYGISVNALATQFTRHLQVPVRKALKPYTIEVSCSVRQWKRLQKDDLVPMQRLIVQRGDDHKFELINALDFKGRA